MSQMSNEDPFEGYEPPANADAVKLNSVNDYVTLEVTDVGTPFEAEHGNVFVITGIVRGKGGPTVEAPDKGETGGYLIAYDKLDKKSGELVPAHVREEAIRAIKANGRQSGAIEPGDLIAFKRDEDVTHSKGGKKFPFPFRHHLVRVLELAKTATADTPF